MCELAIEDQDMSDEEKVLLCLFIDNNGISVASSKGRFDMVARLGRLTKSKDSCKRRYNQYYTTSADYDFHPFLFSQGLLTQALGS